VSALRTRPATPGDLEFVLDSWVETYRLSHFAGPIPMPMYRDAMAAFVKWMLARPGIEVVVAFKPGEEPPNDLYGWVCVERNVPMRVKEFDPVQRKTVEVDKPAPQKVVHFVYVKHMFRTKHVATKLLQACGVDVRAPFAHTHKTAIVAKLKELGKLPDSIFAPQLARFPK
jgi:hypothetical protein